MRLLCDQNVARRYVDACIEAPDLQAVTVRDALDPRATDPDIAAYARDNEYVVLTADDDFFELRAMWLSVLPSARSAACR